MNKDGAQIGLTREVVEHIITCKQEPLWMQKKRFEAFEAYEHAVFPLWAPDISHLDLNTLLYFTDPAVSEVSAWNDLPQEVFDTFSELGIPQAEQEFLGGVGAQYDSNMVYHKLKEELVKEGVIFEDMDVAVKKYPELIEQYFMNTCVPVTDHMFSMLHGAVWSGGTFIYIPKGIKVSQPLQAYFRMNRSLSGQFEHTLIVADEDSEITYIEGCSAPRFVASSLHAGCVEVFVLPRAKVTYISIENWSKNTFNLNTKRALVYRDAEIRWVSGNMGSAVTMLYPSSVLLEEGAKSDMLGVVFAGKGQVQDTGAKAIHLAPNTKSTIRSKSISKDGGVSNYRGLIRVGKKAKGAVSSLVCDSLLLDGDSEANTFPAVKSVNDDVTISHEATIGRIGDEELFYLESRGIPRNEAVRMIISGFVEPITKALPLEYAVEFNKLIEVEMGK